ncbi:MAG: hypothetical protein EOP04_14760 [Proteobacteria bacterium]|nr:MAG: hypothetical protein EOP04_14760 [Pseudomonadota bacterium]
MNKFLIIAAISITYSLPSFAAIPAKVKAPVVGKILTNEGAATGGVAGSGFSLLDMRRTADNKKKIERVVIDIGDMQGQALKGMPAYFHAEMKKNPSKLILDFDQMPISRLDEGRLKDRFKGSLFVKKTSMILDPEDKALNVTLDLKPGTVARVFQVKGNKGTSKVVVDFFEPKATKKR